MVQPSVFMIGSDCLCSPPFSKCCCSLFHHSSYRSSESTSSLPQISAPTQVLHLSCFLSGFYLLFVCFITKKRKMTTEMMFSALLGIKMFFLCLGYATQANLQYLARTHDRTFSGVHHLSILNILFAFLKSSSRGVSRKRVKYKTKHEHVILTDAHGL